MSDLIKQLRDPFASSEVEWRVQQAGIAYNGNPYALVIPYITSRAVQDRLDKVFGVMGWSNEFKAGPQGGVLCGITFKYDGSTVTKWDGAENTKIEPVKGGLSDSMKRAAVQLGIGRYLYELPTYFADAFSDNRKGKNKQKFTSKNKKIADIYGSWNAPALPDFALPHQVLDMRLKSYITELQNCESLDSLKVAFTQVYSWARDDVKSVDYAKRAEAVYKACKNTLKIKELKAEKKQ